jgi:hypothetical protein
MELRRLARKRNHAKTFEIIHPATGTAVKTKKVDSVTRRLAIDRGCRLKIEMVPIPGVWGRSVWKSSCVAMTSTLRPCLA